MKPKTFKKRLVLNKNTIANLSHGGMMGVRGGDVVAEPVDPKPKTTLLLIQCCPRDTLPDCFSEPLTVCWTCWCTSPPYCQEEPVNTAQPV